MTQKIIIAHYHLFKNAGTSVDLILEKNFGAAWQEVEFKKIKQGSNSRLVRDWLLENSSLRAFSSHTAMFPLPTIANVSLLPIVFLRHPIDRLWSVYKFERKHKKILNESIRLARELDFAGYLNYLLDQPQNRSCRNFQTYRFCWLNSERNLTELERALRGLAQIPIVGIVKQFDLSMKLYQQAIAQYYPSFKIESVHKNVTSQQNLTWAEKLDLIRSNLDPDTYQRLLEANQDDLQLYEAAKIKLLAQSPDKVEI